MVLSDGRFPSGAHAYSSGMEQSIAWHDVTGLASLEEFVAGRVATTGAMAAQVAAAASTLMTAATAPQQTIGLDALDSAVDARMASAASRAASRQQGHSWLRGARAVWPAELASASPLLMDRHAWVTLGAATAILGIDPQDAACLALHDLVSTLVWSAVRLLGLDPFEAAGILAGTLAGVETETRALAAEAVPATEALCLGRVETEWISWLAAPLSDLGAEAHAARAERLFAS